MKRPLLLSIFILGLMACGSKTSEQTETAPDLDLASSGQQEVTAEEQQEVSVGEKIYQTYCLVCHQADGAGVPNLNPPLGGSEWVTGDKERLIDVVLNGLQGEVEVKGVTYNNIMISHSFLKDEEIAAVLTYLRAGFGNDSGPITIEEVAEVRTRSGK